MKRILSIILILGLTGCQIISDPEPEPASLVFYGIYDGSEIYEEMIREFEEQNSGIKVTYRRLLPGEYFDRLNEENPQGMPDIMMLPYHRVWEWRDNLLAAEMLIADFSREFVQVGVDTCSWEGQVWCIPVSTDNLALFYNPNLIEEIPETWKDVLKEAQQVYSDSRGQIAGIAWGLYDNITRVEEILILQLLQNGAQIFDEEGVLTLNKRVGTDGKGYHRYPGVETWKFWNQNKTWNESKGYYATEFAHGRLAMLIGYYWMMDRISQENPEANFEVTSIPFWKDLPSKKGSLGMGWAYAVNQNSPNGKESWQFIEFMTNSTNAAAYSDLAGVIPARLDLLNKLSGKHSKQAIFAEQASSVWSLPQHNDWEGIMEQLTPRNMSGLLDINSDN